MCTLVIVPCGSKKTWDEHPEAGPCPAKDAYIGVPFKKNREFAEYCEKRGARWVMLSAKYGFVTPETRIENYDVTFKQKQKNPVSIDVLRKRISSLGLDKYQWVMVLGGKDYCGRTKEAFKGHPCKLEFLTEGLPIGKAMSRLKELMRIGYPCGDR